ncbi:N-acetyltransferase family protein [Tsuneonella sp. HG249]
MPPPASGRVIHTHLTDGTRVCIRTIRPGDEERMRAGIAQMSMRSRYLRFFTALKVPPDRVIDRLLDADGQRHIAWGAIASDLPGEPAIGAVHAYAADEGRDQDCAEFSVAIVDKFQGRGLGRLLTATILLDAAATGYEEFQAWTLAENAGAIAFVKSLGAQLTGRESQVLEFNLPIEGAIAALRENCDPPGLAEVFAAFRPG